MIFKDRLPWIVLGIFTGPLLVVPFFFYNLTRGEDDVVLYDAVPGLLLGSLLCSLFLLLLPGAIILGVLFTQHAGFVAGVTLLSIGGFLLPLTIVCMICFR